MKLPYLIIVLCLFCLSCSDESGGGVSDTLNTSSTQSGSYANIITVPPYMYVLSDDMIISYDISDKSAPIEINRQTLGFGIESIFYRSGILFIGSRVSLFIYEIGDDGVPRELSKTDYTALGINGPCDPVIANDTVAFVSLSARLENESGCGFSDINEIRFYDIQDLENPILLNRLDMETPKGIGLDQNLLFIAESDNGLKVYDVSSVFDPIKLFHFEGFKAFDIIVKNGLLLLVGPDNLYEFDYSNQDSIYLISKFDL